MVIPQLMACGVPVIATTNTGGENIIKDGINGYIIPIRSPDTICEKIEVLFNNAEALTTMKKNASESVNNGFTWDDYGTRYLLNINKKIKKYEKFTNKNFRVSCNTDSR